MNRFVIFIFAIFLSLITVLGDSFVKKASLLQKYSGLRWLVAGSLIYALTAFGWFLVMRRMKLSTAAVVYSISVVIFLSLISVFYFKEKLNPSEIIGIGAALLSLILLYRFI